jgi:nitroreductase
MTDTTTIDISRTIADHPVFETIRARRSMGKMTEEAPSREMVEAIIEAGTWAPNHHLTEPWRFVVLEGSARNAVGEVMGAVDAARQEDPDKAASAAASAAKKPLRAPYVVAIGVEPDPTAPEIEEISAVAAAAQNMLLAAEALGLAAIWRSGWLAFTPEVRDHLGLSAQGKVLGFIYLGYPAGERPSRTRRAVSDVTTWRQE